MNEWELTDTEIDIALEAVPVMQRLTYKGCSAIATAAQKKLVEWLGQVNMASPSTPATPIGEVVHADDLWAGRYSWQVLKAALGVK